jgi:hypothetical protein
MSPDQIESQAVEHSQGYHHPEIEGPLKNLVRALSYHQFTSNA